MKLNVNELGVLLALADSMGGDGSDLCFAGEINYAALGLNARQYAGCIGQLAQKGLIQVDRQVINGRIALGPVRILSKSEPVLRAMDCPHAGSFEAEGIE